MVRGIGLAVFVALLALSRGATAQDREPRANYMPKGGYCADEETAKRVAEAVLTKVYGGKQVKSELPLLAHLESGVWYISGKPLPPGWKGGVAEAEIDQKTCKVLHVIHGK